jgi:superfamily II DNA or RNA helicase
MQPHHGISYNKMAKLRKYQSGAVEFAVDVDKSDCLINMFCGTGKSLVIQTILTTLAAPVSVVVFPSLALIRQFSKTNVLHDNSDLHGHELINISSEWLEDIASTTDLTEITVFLQNQRGQAKLILVTYQSFDVLLAALAQCQQRVDVILYDEAHHVTGDKNKDLVFDSARNLSKKRVYLTATPVNRNGIKMRVEEDDDISDVGPMYEYPYLQALDDGYLAEFEVRADLYTNDTNQCIYEAIARAILTTGNTRVMTFHAGVTGESNTDVHKFVQVDEFQCIFRDVQLKEFPHKASWQPYITFIGVDGGVKSTVRDRVLNDFDQTSDDNVFILSSCDTIGEGVDTKNANMCVFADPKTSTTKIIQNIGRILRLKRDKHGNVVDAQRGTVLIPCWIDRRLYESADDRAAKDQVIREQMQAGAKGNFAPILNVLAALKQSSYELFEACVNYPHPVSRKEKERSLASQGYHIEDEVQYRPEELRKVIDGGEQPVEVHTDGTITQHNENADGVVLRVYEDEENTVFNAIVPENDHNEDNNRRLNAPNKRVPLQFHNNAEIEMLWNIKQDALNMARTITSVVLECEVQPKRGDHMTNVKWIANFQKQTGRLPSKRAANKEEKKYGAILGQYRVHFKKGDRRPHIQYLETNCPGWKISKDDKHMIKAEAVKTVMDRTQRFPSQTATDTTEKKLGAWLSASRTGQNQVPDDVIKFLNENCPGWKDSQDDKHMSNAKAVKTFMDRTKRLPSKEAKDTTEKKLGIWLSNTRTGKSKVGDDVITFLDNNCPGWNYSQDDKHMSTAKAVKTFMDRTKRLPSKEAKDTTEKKLGIWLGNTRTGKSKVGADVIMFLDENCRGWKDSQDDKHMSNAKAVKTFMDRTQSLPSQHAKDTTEKKLGNWLSNTRTGRSKVGADVITYLDDNCRGWRLGNKKPRTSTPKPPPSPEEIVNKYLEKRAKHQAKKKGYASTNPDDKDDINSRIAKAVPRQTHGLFVFLDHTEFKTAHALLEAGVMPAQMVIPQYDAAAAEEMEKHELFGARIERGSLQDCLQNLIDQKAVVTLLYADLTQALPAGIEVLNLAARLQWVPQAVIGITITLRNPEGVEYTNADVTKLCVHMMKRWPTQRSLFVDKFKDGDDIPFTYGDKQPMCTALVQIN